MIRIFKIVTLLFVGLFISCQKPEEATPIPVIPKAEQYPVDLAAIDKYLDEYSMAVNADMDVTFTKIPTPNSGGLQSIRAQYITPSANPFKTVTRDGIDYKVYYISLREGTGKKPTSVDSTLVSYKGLLLDQTVFDQAQNPIWLTLDGVIEGWKEIFPLFKSGDAVADDTNGTVTYTNYGAGVMFLPSALGYYNQRAGLIPGYSPLIFSFKLNKVRYRDHDGDKVLSKFEDLNGDGDFTNDDTDGDGRQDYKDQDDDGDDVLTRFEVRKPTPFSGPSLYYPFDPIFDDPMTAEDETEPKGIPDASGNGTSPTRLRRYLDKNTKPPYTTY
ncbi:FKBP-type peptidyl-prolyl cis-trans isomerase [Flavobacterium sp.]|uniref:FKBP-type peptidyl-prolyl cis-trans isomerase n=1 Tax=Flavobacterium sp. TaxID=239 RepID=UPI0026049DFF|nr:FKBP-type peptidyl-prolyl cis-trans isomerase [Flavobacterium sp.]